MGKKINPIIRGWCNYHRYIVSRKVFEKVDHYVFQLLWKWARGQHPKKSRRWIVNKYFHCGKKWVFATKTKRGEVKEQYLATSTKIRRHILIKGTANPYDQEWDAYFAKREKRKNIPCFV